MEEVAGNREILITNFMPSAILSCPDDSLKCADIEPISSENPHSVIGTKGSSNENNPDFHLTPTDEEEKKSDSRDTCNAEKTGKTSEYSVGYVSSRIISDQNNKESICMEVEGKTKPDGLQSPEAESRDIDNTKTIKTSDYVDGCISGQVFLDKNNEESIYMEVEEETKPDGLQNPEAEFRVISNGQETRKTNDYSDGFISSQFIPDQNDEESIYMEVDETQIKIPGSSHVANITNEPPSQYYYKCKIDYSKNIPDASNGKKYIKLFPLIPVNEVGKNYNYLQTYLPTIECSTLQNVSPKNSSFYVCLQKVNGHDFMTISGNGSSQTKPSKDLAKLLYANFLKNDIKFLSHVRKKFKFEITETGYRLVPYNAAKLSRIARGIHVEDLLNKVESSSVVRKLTENESGLSEPFKNYESLQSDSLKDPEVEKEGIYAEDLINKNKSAVSEAYKNYETLTSDSLKDSKTQNIQDKSENKLPVSDSRPSIDESSENDYTWTQSNSDLNFQSKKAVVKSKSSCCCSHCKKATLKVKSLCCCSYCKGNDGTYETVDQTENSVIVRSETEDSTAMGHQKMADQNSVIVRSGTEGNTAIMEYQQIHRENNRGLVGLEIDDAALESTVEHQQMTEPTAHCGNEVYLDLFKIDNNLSRNILLALNSKHFAAGATTAELVKYLREKVTFNTVAELKQNVQAFLNTAENASILEIRTRRYFLPKASGSRERKLQDDNSSKNTNGKAKNVKDSENSSKNSSTRKRKKSSTEHNKKKGKITNLTKKNRKRSKSNKRKIVEGALITSRPKKNTKTE